MISSTTVRTVGNSSQVTFDANEEQTGERLLLVMNVGLTRMAKVASIELAGLQKAQRVLSQRIDELKAVLPEADLSA